MRWIRFLAFALFSFVAALFGALLSPSTWLHKSLAVALCGVLSANPTLCTNNAIIAASQSQEASATNPVKVETTQSNNFLAQRSRDFDDDTPKSPPRPNPTPPSYQNDSGANIPLRRPDFDDDPNSNKPIQPQNNSKPSRLTPASSSGTGNETCNPKLMTTSAQTGTQVIVRGVPTSFTEIEAGVKTNEIQGLIPTAAKRLKNGDLSIFTPLHPTKLTNGGDVQIVIASGNSVCSPLNFLIEPLAISPNSIGSTKQTAIKAEVFFKKILEISGISQSQLMGDPKNLPQELLPLSLLQWLLDHPQNPNSLKEIFNGNAPILKGKKVDYQIVDNIIANSGLNSTMDNVINIILKRSQNRSSKDDYMYLSQEKMLDKNLTLEPYYMASLGSSLFNFIDCNPKFVSSSDKLNECMWGQKSWEETENSGEWQALVYLVKGILAVISLALIPTGIGAAIVAGSSMGVTIVEILVKLNVTLMPSKLTKLTFVAQPSVIAKGESGTWDQVNLDAESEKFPFTVEGVVELILNVLNLNEFAFKSPLLTLSHSVEEIKQGQEVFNAIRDIVKPWFSLAQIQVGSIGPNKYTKIEAKKETMPATGSSSIISVNFGTNTYQGINRGEATLSLSIKDSTRFAGQNPPNFLQTITVKDKDDQNPPPPNCCSGGGSSWGDPHLVTFDGLRYDHQSVGEFILSKSTDGAFELQVREAPVVGSSSVSLNTAAAMKVGNTRVAFYAKDFPDSDTNNPLRINGKPTVIQGGSLSLPSGGSIRQANQNSYIVQWPTGEQVSIETGQLGKSGYLNVNPGLPQSRQGKVTGLLGDFNGNQTDDLRSRDGQVLPPQSSIQQVTQVTQSFANWIPIPLSQVESLFLDQLNKQFGDSWRISQAESLFDYPQGKNTDSYTNRAFPNGFQILRMLLPQQVQMAEQACRTAGVPAERLEGCLFDVGATGDVDFANIAANIATDFVKKRINEEIQRRIPIPVQIPGLPF